MKRYMHIALIAFLAQCGLSNVIYAMEIKPITIDEDWMIKPRTTGKDSIVNAIKQRSNLTEADVNQYKMLGFGGFSTVAAFVAGATSAVGAGKLASEQSGAIQNVVAGRVPDWMTNPLILAGLGSVGAGLLSYKLLYPPVREEIEHKMIAKIYDFINVCQTLQKQTQHSCAIVNCEYDCTIVNCRFIDLSELKERLPKYWPIGGEKADVAVYWALKDLVDQGANAQTLLNNIQYINVEQLRSEIVNYNRCLSHNLDLYKPIISQENKEEIDQNEKKIAQAKLVNLEEQNKVMTTTRYALYASMLKGGVSSIWNGIKEMYAHPEILALLGVGLITTKYLVPSIIESKMDTVRGFFYHYFYKQ